MKPAPCNSVPSVTLPIRSQRGMGLVEAMVTLVLTAIIGLGMAFLMGRSAVAQKDMNVLGLTVGQMRNQVFSGQCNGTVATTINLNISPSNSTALAIPSQCNSQSTTLTITSDNTTAFTPTTVTVPIPSITTTGNTSQTLFGGQVTMRP